MKDLSVTWHGILYGVIVFDIRTLTDDNRPSGPPVSETDWREPAGASSLGNNFALFVTIFFYRVPRGNHYLGDFRGKFLCLTRIICVDHTGVGFLLVPT